MRVQDFIEYMKKNINRTMKNEQILDLVQKQLEVKKYIPIWIILFLIWQKYLVSAD